MKFIYKTIFLIILSLTGNLLAGEISKNLANKISVLPESDKIEVIISMYNSISSVNLNDQLQSFKGYAQKHKRGIIELKKSAEISQFDLLDELRLLETKGLAENIKSHWIINVVSVRINASEIENIASRADVDEIFQLPQIELIKPVQNEADLSSEFDAIVGDNLTAIGADSAWALGYDGSGRTICLFDTGVEGRHPSLFNSWKGHDGDSAAAWFDPIGQESFPHVFLNLYSVYHGTRTASIMAGYDSTSDEHIGVAPGSKWIAAAVIDILGASIIEAFEWAADPDGNPNTISDVPDVINHSWGLSGIGCHKYFWEMIDNTEALGIINIFAAGNEGEDGEMTIANPANRAYDSLDCFAVGAVDNNNVIAGFSSIGPSDCNTDIIKPNVVAPGVKIRSAYGSKYYNSDPYLGASGTSVAAPHVSGAVAILRQYSPSATVREIKEALLAGCRRLPDIGSEPNNNYGWGLINIPASMEALDSIVAEEYPDVRLYSFSHQPVNPGDYISGHIVLKNFGVSVDSISAWHLYSSPGLTVDTDSLFFGNIETGDTAVSHIMFGAQISDSVPSGEMLTATFFFAGTGGYSNSCKLFIKVGEDPSTGFFTHSNDSLRFTVSNFGQYGFATGSYYPLGYDGFKFGHSQLNHLFEGAFMVGTDNEHVSDGVKNIVLEPDNDFAVSSGGDLVVNLSGSVADQETFSIFNDSRAENPIGLEISQKTLSWNDYPFNSFVIIEYEIKNTTDTIINDIYAGLFFDWDIFDLKDYAQVWTEENLGFVFEPPDTTWEWVDTLLVPTITPGIYRGIAVLNEEGMYSHTLFVTEIKNLFLSESQKYYGLSKGVHEIKPDHTHDIMQTVSTGPFTLAPGQFDSAVFIIAGANFPDDLVASVIQGKNKYYSATDVEISDNINIPKGFYLAQNYPNPFNPVTTISFALDKKSKVKLSIFNLLGEKVTELANDEFSAGAHRIVWDGRDFQGNDVASGVYFYRLSNGAENMTRKMILLK